MTGAEGTLDDVLSSLDKTSTISKENIVSQLDKRIAALKSDPSTVPQATQLEGIKENIIHAMGETSQKPSTIEAWKRGFGKNTNWNDPEKALARKDAYRVLRDSVEGAASGNPETAEAFKDAKNTYGLMAPIREASEKRALQLQQHPIVGLNDLAAAGMGAMSGDPTAGVATAIGRRIVAPRLSSSLAVTADAASKAVSGISNLESKSLSTVLRSNPAVFGKFANVLTQAAQRGDSSLATTDFLLSQDNPEYQQLKRKINNQK